MTDHLAHPSRAIHPFFLVSGSLQISSCRAVRTPAIARIVVAWSMPCKGVCLRRLGGIQKAPE